MIVAVIGLIINLISMKFYFQVHKKALNVKGAYLEVLSDAVGSVGVIIGATLFISRVGCGSILLLQY